MPPANLLLQLPGMRSGATWGPLGRADPYRYSLWREWHPTKPRVAFCMLNPSTADEELNDNTIRRCIGFAQSWGYGGLRVVNLFALRSTDPAGLKLVADPVGPDNDQAILDAARDCEFVVAAWGFHGAYKGRGEQVRKLLPAASVRALAFTDDGFPRHPLYLKANLKPVRW